jgi:hypothetical protein
MPPQEVCLVDSLISVPLSLNFTSVFASLVLFRKLNALALIQTKANGMLFKEALI